MKGIEIENKMSPFTKKMGKKRNYLHKKFQRIYKDFVGLISDF